MEISRSIVRNESHLPSLRGGGVVLVLLGMFHLDSGILFICLHPKQIKTHMALLILIETHCKKNTTNLRGLHRPRKDLRLPQVEIRD